MGHRPSCVPVVLRYTIYIRRINGTHKSHMLEREALAKGKLPERKPMLEREAAAKGKLPERKPSQRGKCE
eukprot:5957842-Prymnesium_polylepis.1